MENMLNDGAKEIIESAQEIKEEEEESEETSETISNKDKVVYWVQVGYYETDLDYEIFKDINVTPIPENQGTYYSSAKKPSLIY